MLKPHLTVGEGAKLCDLTLKSLLGFLPVEEIEVFLSFVAMVLGGGWSWVEPRSKNCLK